MTLCLWRLLDSRTDSSRSRKKKSKCDGVRPVCGRCKRLSLGCRWQSGTWSSPYQPAIREAVDTRDLSPELQPATFPVADDAAAAGKGPVLYEYSPVLVERSIKVFFQYHYGLEFCSFLHRPSFSAAAADPFLVSAIVALACLYLSGRPILVSMASNPCAR